MTVILDNGHGKNTAGKCSPIWGDGSQLFEYKFNRDIVNRISAELTALKINHKILVPELIDISLTERVRRANEIYAKDKDSFLISVHANAGGGTGWEIFTSVGQTKSDTLASVIFVEAHKVLTTIKFRFDVNDGDMDKEADFTILKKTDCPAVLTENMFMDTEKDCKFIMSEHGRQLITKIHVNGIIKYLKLI